MVWSSFSHENHTDHNISCHIYVSALRYIALNMNLQLLYSRRTRTVENVKKQERDMNHDKSVTYQPRRSIIINPSYRSPSELFIRGTEPACRACVSSPSEKTTARVATHKNLRHLPKCSSDEAVWITSKRWVNLSTFLVGHTPLTYPNSSFPQPDWLLSNVNLRGYESYSFIRIKFIWPLLIHVLKKLLPKSPRYWTR